MDDLLNLSETAALLGVHTATVRAWADQGKLPARRTPGGHRRFARADVVTYASAQNRQKDTAVQLVIQNMMGRARLEMHGGGLSLESWYQQLDDTAKREHGEIGRRLLHLVIQYLSGDEDKDLLADLRQVGCDYEKLGRQHGLALAQTTRAYLYFREFLTDAVFDMMSTAGSQSPTDWGDIRRQIVFITNEILLSLIEAHETAIHSKPSA